MKLAIFDFDGTLFPKDTLRYLLIQWKKLNYSKSRYLKTYASLIFLYIRYKSGIKSTLSREEMKIIAMEKFNRIFKDMTEQELKQFFNKCTEDIKGLLNESVVSEIKKAKAEGYHTVLLSGSYDHLLKYIGEYLDFDSVIGTKMYFKNQQYDTSKKLEIVSGKLKLKKIQDKFKFVDWENSRAYADSYSDIHVLKAVGVPVVVNPDNKLQSIASELNWKIIY